MPAASSGTRPELLAALRRLLGPQRRMIAIGTAASLLLAVPDLGRQLLVRNDPSYLHALLVDVVGFISAALVQVALIGVAAGSAPRQWLATGLRLLLTALRTRPLDVVAGLVCAGAVSAVLTLPASIAALGVHQVIGPLHGPPVAALLVAGASDFLATSVTAPYFAVLIASYWTASSR